MDKNKTLTEAANDLIEHAMGQGIPGRMIPFVEALRVAKNERKAESDAARQEIASLRAQLEAVATPAQALPVTVPWENFPSYLIDHCEGDVISEEGLQFALSKMLSNPQYAPQPAAQTQTQTQEDASGWMRDGALLYRLTGERRPANFDEIRVTMANGSRDIGQMSAQAERLLVMLTAPQAAAQDALAYQAACSLATRVFKKHCSKDVEYASGKVTWGLCDTTAGVLSQIDNMVCGLVAPAAQAQAVPAPGVEAVSEREFKQFLSDVLTAAGLVTHGKKCKDLGRRLGEMSMRLLTAPKTAAAPVQAQDALKQVCAIAVSAAKTNSRDIADWREDIDRIAAIAAQKGNHD